MNTEFFNALDLLERERGISKEYMLGKIETAVVAAVRKQMGGLPNVRVSFDTEKKDMRVFIQKTVVEEVVDPDTEITLDEAQAINKRSKIGQVLEREVKTKTVSRLAAVHAKNMIVQAIREAERNITGKKYEDKKEEIVTVTVDKVDESDGTIVVDTGSVKVPLFKQDQVEGETYMAGDRMKVFITEVRPSEARGPIIAVSRVHPGLVKRLFELNIPEVGDGTVEVKSVAREPGSRSKVAVLSNDPNVDPVGTCIGPHGSRIASVLQDLGNEKIDIVRYSDDKATYVKEALAPAEVISVTYDGERCCEVRVSPDQLSLAIGKEGQNAKLAAKLTGCKIDIKA